MLSHLCICREIVLRGVLSPAAWPGHSDGLRVLPSAGSSVGPAQDTDPDPLLGEEPQATVLLVSPRDPPVSPLGPGGPLLEIYSGLSLVELLHYCPLIGRELNSIAGASSLMP